MGGVRSSILILYSSGVHVNSPSPIARHGKHARAIDANLLQRLSIPKREQNPRAPDAHLPAAVGNVDTKRSSNLAAGVAQRGPVVEDEAHRCESRMRGGELSQAWVGVHACQQIDHLLVDLNPIVHKVLR